MDFTCGVLIELTMKGECGSMYENPDAYIRRLDNGAQSPAEKDLHDILLKLYPARQIEPQVKVGKYRIDVVTADGIGWEVDGKQWHDVEQDKRRDAEILATGQVGALIRFPASVSYYFYEAAIHAADTLTAGRMGRLKQPNYEDTVCKSWQLQKQADNLEESIYLNGQDQLQFDAFCSQQCFAVNDELDVVEVGHPFAFLHQSHRLWSRIDAGSLAIASWSACVVKRDLSNQDRWR